MAPAPAPKPSPTTLIKIPAAIPPAVSSVCELTPVLLLVTQLALSDPTMMARAMIVPTAEIRAPTRPARVAAPMVPPPRAVTKPAAPMSPRKTRNASRPSGELRWQVSPLAVALPIQFKSNVTTADATPNFTAFPDQPFMMYLPRPSPSPFPSLSSSPELALLDKPLTQVEKRPESRGHQGARDDTGDEGDAQGGQAAGDDHGGNLHVELDHAVRAGELDRHQGRQQRWRQPRGARCDRGRDAGKHRPGGAHDKGEPGQAEDQNKR